MVKGFLKKEKTNCDIWAGGERRGMVKNGIFSSDILFNLKDQILKDLTSGIICNFQCGLCSVSHYGDCVRYLNVRIGEYIGISPLTKKQAKPKNRSVANHLLLQPLRIPTILVI